MIRETQTSKDTTGSAVPLSVQMRINDHFQVVDVSEDILYLTGWTSRDLTGHLIQELIHPSDKAQMQSLLAVGSEGTHQRSPASARLQHAADGWILVDFKLAGPADTDSEGRTLLLSEAQPSQEPEPHPLSTPSDALASVISLFEHDDLCIIFDSDLQVAWASPAIHQNFDALDDTVEPWSEAQFFDHYQFTTRSQRLTSPPVFLDPETELWQGPVSVTVSGKTQHFQCRRKIWKPHDSEAPYVVLLLDPTEVAGHAQFSTTESSFSAIRLVTHEFRNILSVIGGHSSLLSAEPGHPNHHSIEQLTQYNQQAIALLESLSLLGHLDDSQIAAFSPVQHIRELEPVLQLAMRKRLTLSIQDHIDTFECQGLTAHFDLALLQSAQACQSLLTDSGHVRIEVTVGDGYIDFVLTLTNIDAHLVSSASIDPRGDKATQESVRDQFEPLHRLAEEYESELRISLEKDRLTLGLSLPGQQLPKKTTLRSIASERVIKQALLIEDDLGVSDLVSLFLGSLGLDVTSCASEQDVVALSNYDFDIIVSDVMLTGSKTGPHLVREIRRDNPAIACLFISGYKHGALSQADLEHPKTDFLAKPFSKQDFSDRVEALMALRDQD